jgi:oligopeptide transport system permease protein
MLLKFLLGRLVRGAAVLLGVVLIMFLLMHAIPGNPWSNYSSAARMQMGTSSDQLFQRQLSRYYGLDLPLWRQFTRYVFGDLDQERRFVCGAVCGSLGPSISERGRTVSEVLFEPPEGKTSWDSRFGYSIRLVLFGSLIAVGLGIPLGILSGARPNSGVSRLISVGLAALISVPNFVLGLLAIIVLASWLDLIPVLPDWNQPTHWIVPAVVLAVMPMASIARVTRASVINVTGEDYIRTARGKGLPPGYVLRVHVMRNALVSILTFLGPILMEMFIALLVVENLYAFPGFGSEYWQAVVALDYPVIMGLTLLYAIGVLFVNLIIAVICEVLDPRLRSIQQPGAP